MPLLTDFQAVYNELGPLPPIALDIGMFTAYFPALPDQLPALKASDISAASRSLGKARRQHYAWAHNALMSLLDCYLGRLGLSLEEALAKAEADTNRRADLLKNLAESRAAVKAFATAARAAKVALADGSLPECLTAVLKEVCSASEESTLRLALMMPGETLRLLSVRFSVTVIGTDISTVKFMSLLSCLESALRNNVQSDNSETAAESDDYMVTLRREFRAGLPESDKEAVGDRLLLALASLTMLGTRSMTRNFVFHEAGLNAEAAEEFFAWLPRMGNFLWAGGFDTKEFDDRKPGLLQDARINGSMISEMLRVGAEQGALSLMDRPEPAAAFTRRYLAVIGRVARFLLKRDKLAMNTAYLPKTDDDARAAAVRQGLRLAAIIGAKLYRRVYEESLEPSAGDRSNMADSRNRLLAVFEAWEEETDSQSNPPENSAC